MDRGTRAEERAIGFADLANQLPAPAVCEYRALLIDQRREHEAIALRFDLRHRGFVHERQRRRRIARSPRHFRGQIDRSEEHTSELQSLMRISYAVFCLKKKKKNYNNQLCNKNYI